MSESIKTELIKNSAAELADKIANQEITAVAVAEAHLERIDAVDGSVHAFLHVDSERALDQAALRLGLVRFVTTVVAPLNVAVGDAWMHGRFQVFEEHLYTECVTGVLRNAIGSIPPPLGAGAPRVVLTTFAQEAHGLGLLMAEALFALERCACLSLGTRTPMGDIVQAAQAHNADVVALSFTAALSPHVVVAGLRDLRRQLGPKTAIWVGGQCPVLYQRAMPGILAVRALESIAGQIAHWRREERDAALHAKGA